MSYILFGFNGFNTSIVLLLSLVLVLNSSFTLAKTDLDDILEKYNEIYSPSKAATDVVMETIPPNVFTPEIITSVFTYSELPLPSLASTAELLTTSETTTKFPAVDFARSRCLDNSICQSISGIWFSINFETVFEVKQVPDIFCRFEIRSSGVGWNGFGECLFADRGPISLFIGDPQTGQAATFVGQCYVLDGKDTITGIWVMAFPDKFAIDPHLALQSIPDTLQRLNITIQP